MAFDTKGDGDVEKAGGDISTLDEETEIVQAQQPLSVKDLELAAGEGREGNGLPFSKARCIALVATVTGAAFLNVRLSFPDGLG